MGIGRPDADLVPSGGCWLPADTELTPATLASLADQFGRTPKRLTISGEIDGSDMALTSPGDTADLVTAKRHDALGAAK